MWNTPEGTRKLTGDHAEFWKRAAMLLAEQFAVLYEVSPDFHDYFGHGNKHLLDELDPPTLLSLLLSVSQRLLDDSKPKDAQTAYEECLIYEVHANAIVWVDRADKSCADAQLWKVIKRISESYRDDETGKKLYSMRCNADIEDLLDSLADNILWDRDWEMYETFADLNPDARRDMFVQMGISGEYFSAVPEISKKTMTELVVELRQYLET